MSAQPDESALVSACRDLVDYLDKNPPMGESIWSIQLIRAALGRTNVDAKVFTSDKYPSPFPPEVEQSVRCLRALCVDGMYKDRLGALLPWIMRTALHPYHITLLRQAREALEAQPAVTREVWKDGIDVDVPVHHTELRNKSLEAIRKAGV